MALPASAFWDRDPADRQRAVASLAKLDVQLVEEAANPPTCSMDPMVTPSTPGAPPLRATSNHAAHSTPLRWTLSNSARNRRLRHCLAAR
jgi:hypothetical protein